MRIFACNKKSLLGLCNQNNTSRDKIMIKKKIKYSSYFTFTQQFQTGFFSNVHYHPQFGFYTELTAYLPLLDEVE